jgi:hypothetical protein
MESQHRLLTSAGGGLDQSTITMKRRHCGYVIHGCLIGGKGINILT